MTHVSDNNSLAGGQDKKRYLQVWRWHFYAGLYVLPFILMLAITGILMLTYYPFIEPWLHRDLVRVSTQATPYLSWEAQRQQVQTAFPQAQIVQLRLPHDAGESSQFTLKTSTGDTLIAYLNPYSGEVLGSLDKNASLYALADEIHGTLLLGAWGDALIELAAGFTLILLITGLYMWWPRGEEHWSRLWLPNLRQRQRALWKELHVSTGAYLSVILVFFVFSGLSWSGIWGEKIVQPWNSFPAGQFDNVPLSDSTHATMNHGAEELVPWNLAQTPLPASGSPAGAEGIPQALAINLDSVIAFGKDNGMRLFRVGLPKSATGVYSLMASTMSRDITDARQDRVIHLDQYTGKKLADIRFADYSLMAKAMAVGIPLHMGTWSDWNLYLNLAICVLVIFLCVSGAALWWKRRPQGQGLTWRAPPQPQGLMHWQAGLLIWLSVSLFVPVVGAVVLALLLFDVLIGARLLPPQPEPN